MNDIFLKSIVEHSMETTDKYYIVITCENEHIKELMHYLEYPEDGTLIAIQWFSTKKELYEMTVPFEGMFYQIFNNKTHKRLEYGMIDPDFSEEFFETEVA